MSVLAQDAITITDLNDVTQIITWYQLTSSLTSIPTAPTFKWYGSSQPTDGMVTNDYWYNTSDEYLYKYSGGSWSRDTSATLLWTTTEPTYISGDASFLYTVPLNVFGDGSCVWGEISLSTSYEAAKEACNAAAAAQSAASDAVDIATAAQGAAETAQSNIDATRSWYATCSSTGSSTAKVATITPATTAFSLHNGAIVYVKFDNTNSGAVASLTLNVNGTGAKPIKYLNNSSIGNLASAGYIVAGGMYQFNYDGTNWLINMNYNSNTYDRTQYKASVTASGAISAGRIGVFNTSGKLILLSTTAFDITKPILYIGTAYTSEALTQTNNYTMYGTAFALTNTHSITGAAAGSAVYIVGSLTGTTFTPNSSVLTCTKPTSADGLYYIRLGLMSTAANAVLEAEHPMYAFINGAFQRVDLGGVGLANSAVANTVSCYYRSTTSIANPDTTIKPTSSTTIGTNNDTSNAWEYVMPVPKHGCYFYTCEKYTLVGGTIEFSTVRPLDSETYASKWVSSADSTYIDGGAIYANSVTADKINANSINASGILTVGAMSSEAQSSILNSELAADIADTYATQEEATALVTSEDQYYLSSSDSSATGGSWGTSVPTWSSGKYIWVRTATTTTTVSGVSTTTYKPTEAGMYDSALTSALSSSNTNATNLATEIAERKAKYGTQTATSSDASSQTKAITCSNFELVAGNELTIYFKYANTYSSNTVKLNVNEKGAKDIWVANAVTSSTNQLLWGAGAYITFRYDGVRFIVIGEPRTWYGASTTAASTAAKTDTTAVTGCVICKGAKVELAMTNGNTNTSATLNIQSTGAKNIYYGNTTTRPTSDNGHAWIAATTATFTFDGQYWRIGGQTVISGDSITTGTINSNRLDVAGLISANSIAVTSDIPTKTSDLTNDSDFTTATAVSNTYAPKTSAVSSVSTKNQYYLSTSNSSATGSSAGWQNSIPTWTTGKYIWIRVATTITPVSGAATTTYAPSESGMYDSALTTALSELENKADSTDAASSVITTQEYYLSTSSSSATGGTWSSTIPTWVSGKYIWTRLKIVTTPVSGSTTTSYSPSEAGTLDNALNNVASAIVAAQEDIDSANLQEQRIYYRTTQEKRFDVSRDYPTTWVAESDTNTYNAWTTKIPPLASSTAGNATKYPYLYTCIQRKTVDGTITHTTALLDENTTVIDGGNIITSSVTANQIAANAITADKLNTTSINASGSLTVGAVNTSDTNTVNAILNSALSSDISDAAKVATDYLSFSPQSGLDIGYSDTLAKTRITGSGVEIFDSSAVSTAFFGAEARVGSLSTSHSSFSETDTLFYDYNQDIIGQISYGSFTSQHVSFTTDIYTGAQTINIPLIYHPVNPLSITISTFVFDGDYYNKDTLIEEPQYEPADVIITAIDTEYETKARTDPLNGGGGSSVLQSFYLTLTSDLTGGHYVLNITASQGSSSFPHYMFTISYESILTKPFYRFGRTMAPSLLSSREPGIAAFETGSMCWSKGDNSFTSGKDTEAWNDNSASFGIGTVAARNGQLACGEYNYANESAEFIVGNGLSGTQRHNAFVVDSSGDIEVSGDISCAGNIEVNGDLICRGAIFPDGYVDSTGTISLASATATTVCTTAALKPGLYLITAEAHWDTNATGRRTVSLAVQSGNEWVTDPLATSAVNAVSGVNTRAHITYLIALTTATTYGLRAYQNSGSTLGCSGTIRVLRLSSDYEEPELILDET